MMTRSLFGCIGMLACVSGAAAQSAPATSGPGQAGVGDVSAGVAEIVVTASRRSENIQRTALSIQSLSAETLTRANINKPEDLSSIAPGVSIGTSASAPLTYIRGVGSYNTQAYGEGAVAYNLDGVYISRGWATRGMFYDLDRVEVLKGPQGTLYGRNASGGAINVITAKPNFDRVSGFAELQAGNYDLIQGTAAINAPLSDKLAVRAAGQVISRNGYLSDGYDDAKSQSGRLQVLIKPSDDFSLLLNGNYQHLGGQGAGAVLNPSLPGSSWRGISDPAVTAIIQAQPATGPVLITSKTDGFIDATVYAVGAEMNWNLGFATLTVLPAYREAKYDDRFYTVFNVDDHDRNQQTSAEARLANDGEHLKWLVGAYYFNEHDHSPNGLPIQLTRQGPAANVTQRLDLHTRSYAVFGQGTYSLTDRLRVTAGLRYTYERKLLDGQYLAYARPAAPPSPTCAPGRVVDPNPPVPPISCRLDIPLSGRQIYNNVTYKAGMEFDLAPQSMAYVNVSTGFKSGGFFSAPPPNTFLPEKLTAVDAGVKNRFLDNRLQVNLEAFYWRYKDHQESHIAPTSLPGFLGFITENAGSAESYGADLDILFRATRDDELSFKVQYNKSKYNKFQYSNPTAISGPPAVNCAVGPLTAGAQIVDCSGKQLVRAPSWSGTAGYSHTFDFGNNGKLTASADVQFASSSWLAIEFFPAEQQKAYAIGNLELSYTPDTERWVMSGFVRNISNEGVLTQAVRSAFITPANPFASQLSPNGMIIASIRPPRTFGGRVRFNF